MTIKYQIPSDVCNEIDRLRTMAAKYRYRRDSMYGAPSLKSVRLLLGRNQRAALKTLCHTLNASVERSEFMGLQVLPVDLGDYAEIVEVVK